MGKTPKLKSGSVSKHSRAARRAASPSLDLDKSITTLPRVEEDVSTRSSFLAAQHNSGVSKKSKIKQKTRAQKRRQAKGIERAEMVMDKIQIKVAKSVERGKRVKARKAAWEDLNGEKRTLVRKNVDRMDTSEQEGQPAQLAPMTFTPPPQIPPPEEKVEDEEEDEIT
ncbi:hypothetical protein VTO42DRAFT_7862 [Malbranchea cinnamomea]